MPALQFKTNLHSKVYGFMSAEYDYTWAEFLDPHDSSSGIFSGQSFSANSQGDMPAGASFSLKEPETSQQKEVATAYAKLKEYATTNQPSRPSSPSSAKAHEQFIQNLGHTSPYGCDRLVLDGQLSISRKSVL